MITCLMGVAVALSCAYAPGGPLSALAARTVALETRPRRRKVVVFMIWHSVGWVPLTLRPAGPAGRRALRALRSVGRRQERREGMSRRIGGMTQERQSERRLDGLEQRIVAVEARVDLAAHAVVGDHDHPYLVVEVVRLVAVGARQQRAGLADTSGSGR